MVKRINVLSSESFKKYGIIIEPKISNVEVRSFEVIETAPSEGWRIGILQLVKDEMTYIERHLKTKETYEPLSGTTIMLVSLQESPHDMEVFLLDKPVCVNEGIWHQVVAISEKAIIKVIENITVPHYECEIFYLEDGVNVSVTFEMKLNSTKTPET